MLDDKIPNNMATEDADRISMIDRRALDKGIPDRKMPDESMLVNGTPDRRAPDCSTMDGNTTDCLRRLADDCLSGTYLH